jgi:hypothetical protein
MSKQKDLLYRRANGKRLLDDYLGKISTLFLVESRSGIVSLEETDLVLDRFRSMSVQLRRETGRISRSDFHVELSTIKRHHKGFYVLIDEDWKYCGMLLVPNLEALNVNVEFGEKILNDIIFVSDDMSFAISFDFFEDAGSYLIDIEKWQAESCGNTGISIQSQK